MIGPGIALYVGANTKGSNKGSAGAITGGGKAIVGSGGDGNTGTGTGAAKGIVGNGAAKGNAGG